MKRISAFLAASVLLLGSCESYKDLKVTSVKVESLSPTSLRSLDAVLKVEVYNPSCAFTVSGLTGTLHVDGTPLVDLRCEEVRINAKCVEEYEVNAGGSLSRGAGLSSFGTLLGSPEKLSADVSGLIRGPFGIKRAFEYKNIPLCK